MSPLSSDSHDQASGLRRLFERRTTTLVPILAQARASGGLVANLGVAAGRGGRRTLIVDETSGTVALAVGLSARFELAHVLAGDSTFEKAILAIDENTDLLPATRGLAALSERGLTLDNVFAGLPRRPDLALVHTSSPRRAARLLGAHAGVLIPVAGGSAGLTDAYLELKRSAARGESLRALVHGVADADAAYGQYAALASATARFLAAPVRYAGFVPGDAALARSRREQRSVFEIDASAASARALEQLAAQLAAHATERASSESPAQPLQRSRVSPEKKAPADLAVATH